MTDHQSSEAHSGTNSGHSAENQNADASVSVPVAHEFVKKLSASERSRFFAGWTEERVQLLCDLWFAPGQTRSTVAAALGPGFTASAVVGKAHRLGLVKRGKMVAKEPVAKRAAAPPSIRLAFNATPQRLPLPKKPEVAEPTFEATPALECEGVTIMELRDHHCRWPIGDPQQFESFRYCGQQTNTPKGPYCGAHMKIANVAITPKHVGVRAFYR